MLQVERLFNEVGAFIDQLKVDIVVIELISGWKVDESFNASHHFLNSGFVSINRGQNSLSDVVNSSIKNIKVGKNIVVILADNRNHSTQMEYFTCNIPVESDLTAKQIVEKSNVRFFSGDNYYGEEML